MSDGSKTGVLNRAVYIRVLLWGYIEVHHYRQKTVLFILKNWKRRWKNWRCVFRYWDDIKILAAGRWKVKTAIRVLYENLGELSLDK